MNIGCKYKAKELKNVNFVDLYYMYYYVWPKIIEQIFFDFLNYPYMTISIAWQEVVYIKVKKLEILFLLNITIFVVQYILMLLLKRTVVQWLLFMVTC